MTSDITTHYSIKFSVDFLYTKGIYQVTVI